jgi:hypothetical protein
MVERKSERTYRCRVMDIFVDVGCLERGFSHLYHLEVVGASCALQGAVAFVGGFFSFLLSFMPPS